jgi:hypothetical protein
MHGGGRSRHGPGPRIGQAQDPVSPAVACELQVEVYLAEGCSHVSKRLGLWVDLCVVAEAGDDEQPDRFGPGAPMVSSVGVDSGQQMPQAYLNPTTDFGPTGSPFVR